MKEDNTIDKIVIVRHLRHCVVLINAILGLAFLHYTGYLLHKIVTALF